MMYRTIMEEAFDKMPSEFSSNEFVKYCRERGMKTGDRCLHFLLKKAHKVGRRQWIKEVSDSTMDEEKAIQVLKATGRYKITKIMYVEI